MFTRFIKHETLRNFSQIKSVSFFIVAVCTLNTSDTVYYEADLTIKKIFVHLIATAILNAEVVS